METNNLVFVAETKYKNKCIACTKDIPAGSECYWEKNTKNNYHVICKPKIPASPKQSPQAAPAQANSGLHDLNTEAGLPEPLDLKATLTESINQATAILDVERIEASRSDLMLAIFKAKLQSQHQKFEVQMAKHKEAVWNRK